MSLYCLPAAIRPSREHNPCSTPAQCDCPASFPVPALCVCVHVPRPHVPAPHLGFFPRSWGRLDGDHPALLRCPALQAQAGSSWEELRCFERFARLGGFGQGWRGGGIELLSLGRVLILVPNVEIGLRGITPVSWELRYTLRDVSWWRGSRRYFFFTAGLQSCAGGPGLCAGLEVARALGCATGAQLCRGKAAVPSLRSGGRPAPLLLGHGCHRLLERVRCQKLMLGAAHVSASPGCSEPRSLFPGKPSWNWLRCGARRFVQGQTCPICLSSGRPSAAR